LAGAGGGAGVGDASATLAFFAGAGVGLALCFLGLPAGDVPSVAAAFSEVSAFAWLSCLGSSALASSAGVVAVVLQEVAATANAERRMHGTSRDA
jgi:hypothetical protein